MVFRWYSHLNILSNSPKKIKWRILFPHYCCKQNSQGNDTGSSTLIVSFLLFTQTLFFLASCDGALKIHKLIQSFSTALKKLVGENI